MTPVLVIHLHKGAPVDPALPRRDALEAERVLGQCGVSTVVSGLASMILWALCRIVGLPPRFSLQQACSIPPRQEAFFQKPCTIEGLVLFKSKSIKIRVIAEEIGLYPSLVYSTIHQNLTLCSP